jgi:hypothetical protein
METYRIVVTRSSRAVLFWGVLAGAISSVAADDLPVGLLCVTSDGASPQRHFAINFDVANSRWTESEPGNTTDLFKTKSGNYVVVSNSTSMRAGSGSTVVGQLNGFNPATATDGSKGTGGQAMETARIFDWTVAIPHQAK